MVVSEEVNCKVLPWGIWCISWEHRLDWLLGLMLGTDLGMIIIISNVSICSGLVDIGLGEVSHLLYLCGCCVDH